MTTMRELVEQVVGPLSDLPDPGCREFAVGEGDWPFRGFVVRQGDELHAYRNYCKHAGHPLNWKPDSFLTKDASHIICASHGALYDINTGDVHAYDEATKTCSVRVDLIDAPRLFPIDHNSLHFSVVDDPDGGSTATWVFGAALKPWGYLMWPMLRMGMFKAWNELCEEFQHYVETGTPHPRKAAAREKASSASG